MAETICRALRDGSLAGEHATALTIKDSIPSPFGFDAFTHFLASLSSNICAGKSQSQGIVLIAFTKSPSFYFDLLKSRGIDASSSSKWLRILDCYSDPLGWKDGVKMVGPSKARFSVAIDSVTVMLRHAALSCRSAFILDVHLGGRLCFLCLLVDPSDLHEARTIAVLEYMSSMFASLEPMTVTAKEQRNDSEKFHVEQAGIKFSVNSFTNDIVSQSLLPKVQFNLQLSEKERSDRENVVLPFEHQEMGKTTEIYDGRRSLSNYATDLSTTSASISEKRHSEANIDGKGEIYYLRDSDDEETPDSDEDPDDDLDI
ncbi:hypothetical protein MKW92_036518 [Papaver armeniacum]|nr:hypothetical protein MKW92_036518 [Papaver armeniacum]